MLGKVAFLEEVVKIVKRYQYDAREIVPTLAARDFYTNWYNNRFKYFGPTVRPYANRSRDHLHRIAMLMAISRGNGYLEEVDYRFGAEMVRDVAEKIEVALIRKR